MMLCGALLENVYEIVMVIFSIMYLLFQETDIRFCFVFFSPIFLSALQKPKHLYILKQFFSAFQMH